MELFFRTAVENILQVTDKQRTKCFVMELFHTGYSVFFFGWGGWQLGKENYSNIPMKKRVRQFGDRNIVFVRLISDYGGSELIQT